ncbi:MAG: bifunctional (p)ppGpp synthetase/guanosine-3',5'-bis(diphosphate) 3'-pyrophosphohydrolase, partial [Alphaproteobacteria bacterium]|nr:bifunctional (p)ppGpp synthetase/guanosine-3',5'-bis(diphosphate) 3'-pyrophosphohydrolase [Alphaproteobacteria bacterium]
YAMKKHGPQKRASGDPYFSHPLEVAYILTGLKLDTASIITALLHDTVEDTDATLEEIESLFGKEISTLVDGVTKLGRLESKTENAKQAENFRKLLLAMSEDIRVLLVKLSDRLHNMRTLHHIKKEEKRKRIAQETLDIYAVLSERIGMRQIKEELQDLAFAELRTEERNSIVNRLNFLREQGKSEVEKTMEEITRVLKEAGVEHFEITGREKRPYSIWKKMAQKSLNFEQMSDIIAFRVIVDSIPSCYHALGAIHAKWHMIPDEFDDYISTPKSNGYKSLHTAVIGPLQHRIEVQIRTRDMHLVAENGVAAHWSYKQGQSAITEGKQFRWMRELLEILDRATSPEDFLENTKLEMYQDQVFCFSPKGDLIALPRNATPVDFAYAVHSRIGDTCVGAKVNGRIVPLRAQLHNGDQVEIITSKTQTPSPSWERFVVTGKARSAIRKFVRTQQRNEYVILGKAIIQKMFKQENADFNEKKLEEEVGHFNKKHLEDFYAEVGEGLISRQHVTEHFFPKKQSAADVIRTRLFRRKPSDVNAGMKREAVPIRGLIPGMAMHFAGCCHPIPGDRIMGVIITGKGVTIHTQDCERVQEVERNDPSRVIDVSWEQSVGESASSAYVGRVKAVVAHETGGLAAVTNAIAKDLGNITNIKIINRASDFFEMLIDIEVQDVNHLNNIIASLRAKSIVHAIDRYA